MDGLLGGGGRNHPAVRQHLGLQGRSVRFTEGSTHHGLAERTEGGALQRENVCWSTLKIIKIKIISANLGDVLSNVFAPVCRYRFIALLQLKKYINFTALNPQKFYWSSISTILDSSDIVWRTFLNWLLT